MNEHKNWFRKNRNRAIAATAAVAIAAGGAAELKSKTENHPIKPETPVEQIVPNDKHPQPEIDDYSRTLTELAGFMNPDLKNEDYSAYIIEPDQGSKDYFAQQFLNENGLPFTDHPPLREVAIIHDQGVFSQKELEKPGTFNVYNASEKPLDLQFIRFSLEATKLWLDKWHDKEILIGGRTTARVSQFNVPHEMFVLDSIPKEIAGESPADALTIYNRNGINTSFISTTRVDMKRITPKSRYTVFKDPARAYQYSKLSVEVCQNLVNVHNVKKVPGGYGAAEDAGEFVHGVNPGGGENEDNTELTAQEVACNGLGDIEMAIYLGGIEAAKRLALKNQFVQGVRHTSVIDYSLYVPYLEEFQSLMHKIDDDPGMVSTIGGQHTPTLDHLRKLAED